MTGRLSMNFASTGHRRLLSITMGWGLGPFQGEAIDIEKWIPNANKQTNSTIESCFSPCTYLTVREGRSAMTVPIPTQIAEWIARSWWVIFKDSLLLNCNGCPMYWALVMRSHSNAFTSTSASASASACNKQESVLKTKRTRPTYQLLQQCSHQYFEQTWVLQKVIMSSIPASLDCWSYPLLAAAASSLSTPS